MKKILAILISMTFFISGCAFQIKDKDIQHYSDGSYNGEIATKVSTFDTKLANCLDKRNNLADDYNGISNSAWHWDFWPATLGLATQATAGLLTYFGQEETGRIISISSGSIVAFVVGLQLISGINSRLSEKSNDISRFDSIIDNSIKAFSGIQPELRNGDDNALQKLDALNVDLTGNCS